MKVRNSHPLFISIIIASCLWKPCDLKYNDTNCIHQCGKIDIPYPFGIGPSNCYSNPYFAVICKDSSSSRIPFLNIFNLEIVEVKTYYSNSYGAVIVKIPPVTACSGTEILWNSPNFNASPFYLEDGTNVFASVGCHGYASFFDSKGNIVGGCTSTCALGHQDSQITSTAYKVDQCYGFNKCCQIKIPVADEYSIVVSNKNGSGSCRSAFLISRDDIAILASTVLPMSTAPVELQWDNTDFIRITIASTVGTIASTVGSFMLAIVLYLFLVCCCVGLCWWCKTKKRRKEIKLRKKYFKGRISEQRFSQEEAKKTKLFSKKELKKATENFNEDRILGKGGQGTVYKGMLNDGKLIAVKKSISLSESQCREFINEVIILSNVNHRNVVKLLGCCLETKSLLLVYEFISNGTLSDFIHNRSEEFRVTWNVRLRIASEVAGAIAYLHSACSTPIFHRDIKTSNILLDHNYAAKVCDFGISKSTSMDQTHVTTCVRGTFGYLDPQYFRSNQFSEKSDVYSFGVVPVELLTGQKPIITTSEYATSLVVQFMSLTDDTALYEMLDPIILSNNDAVEEIMAVVHLAKCCLHPLGTGRPTMTQIANELAGLKPKVYTKSASSNYKTDSSHEFFSTKTHLDESGSF